MFKYIIGKSWKQSFTFLAKAISLSEMTYFDSRIPILQEFGFLEANLPKLKAYIEFLWSANDELNLISRKMSPEELIDNHLIDCLLPLNYFPKNIQHAADFGSGGGLPSLIYAIHFPNMRYSLYEKSPKKQEFLKRCQKQFAPNIEVYGEIPRDLTSVELVTARAFKPIDVILELSRNYYKSGGKYFLLKGRLEKIEEELIFARKKAKDLKTEIRALKSPVLEVERHLVLI